MQTRISQLLLIALSFLVFNCVPTEENPTDDNQDLTEVIGNGNIASYRVAEDGMTVTVTFENGQTATITFPQSINGTNGTDGQDGENGTDGQDGENGSDGQDGTNGQDGENGADGVGIESIDFDEASGELIITLTNGVVYRFEIVVNGGVIEDSKLVDVDGMYFLKSLKLGVTEMASFEYNEAFQITIANIFDNEDGEAVLTSQLVNTYEDGKVTYTEQIEYASRNRVDYNVQYFNTGYIAYYYDYIVEEAVVTTDITFTYNEVNDALEITQNGSGYGFYLYGEDYETFVISETKSDSFDHDKTVKKSDTETWEYVHLFDNEENVYYILNRKYTDIRTIAKGEKLSSDYAYREYDGDKVSKVYSTEEKDGDYDEYVTMTYSGDNITKIEGYYKDEDGNYVKSEGDEVSLVYNTDNKLESMIASEEISDSDSDTVFRVVYDANLNPIEIWAFQDAVFSYEYVHNQETGVVGYDYVKIREEGFRKVAVLEYYDNMKNFFGHTINSIFPELKNIELNNAPKRVSLLEDGSSMKFEYKEFNMGGYPESVQILISEDGDGEYYLYEGVMDYSIKK